MPLVKYVANPLGSLNAEIYLAAGEDGKPRSLTLGGDSLEITGEEFIAIAANGYELEQVEDDEATTPAEPAYTPPPTQSFGASITTIQPVSPGA